MQDQPFGTRKKATSVLFSEQKGYLSPGSLNDYLSWLQQKHIYTFKDRTQDSLRALVARMTMHALYAVAGIAPRRLRRYIRYIRSCGYVARASVMVSNDTGLRRYIRWCLCRLAQFESQDERQELFRRYVFPWAMEQAKKRYIQNI